MPFDDETTDVLIGGYLSADAAHQDYEAVLHSGGYLHGAVVVTKDLEGNLAVEQTDHMVRRRRRGSGRGRPGGGALRAAPARRHRDRGRRRRRRRQSLAQKNGQQDRGNGRPDHPHRWRRPDRRLPALGGTEGRARYHSCHPKGGRRSRRSPRESPQGRPRRRPGKNGPRKHVATPGGSKDTSPTDLSDLSRAEGMNRQAPRHSRRPSKKSSPGR